MTNIRNASIAAAILFSTGSLASPSVFPTGTTKYDPAKAYNSYVLFTATDNITRLIDMNGNEVKRWDHLGFPPQIIDPALTGGKRGHILLQIDASGNPGVGTVPGAGIPSTKTVGELDWDGKVVWQWGAKAPNGEARQHHDWQRLPNGNTLLLASTVNKVEGFARPKQINDVIYEVTSAGDIAWQWDMSAHLDELGFTSDQLKSIRASTNPDYFHLNDARPIGPNKWYDGGDKRFNPDNVLISSRNANFLAIVDRQSGKLVWHLGPNLPPLVRHEANAKPIAFSAKNRPVEQFSGQHDAYIIPKGLPGEGNLLVFDNQGEAGYPVAELPVVEGSRVLEINPVSGQIVWAYAADSSDQPSWAFRSSFMSSARRLPNGNTLIDEAVNGRFFQVTPGGEIVWEYISPYYAKSSSAGSPHPVLSNWVYRATPVEYGWVPQNTPHSENGVTLTDNRDFHLPVSNKR